MSGSGRSTTPTVVREYRNAPEDCARALEPLLKKSVISKEGGPYTAPDDRKGLRNDPARTKHTR